MPIYVIAVVPLLLIVLEIMKTKNTVKMAAYADDFIAEGSIKSLKRYWDTLCRLGPKFVYYPDAKKSWLIIKEEFKRKAKGVLKDSAVKITSTTRRHVGLLLEKHCLKKSI